jgi:hypothetical protein
MFAPAVHRKYPVHRPFIPPDAGAAAQPIPASLLTTNSANALCVIFIEALGANTARGQE